MVGPPVSSHLTCIDKSRRHRATMQTLSSSLALSLPNNPPRIVIQLPTPTPLMRSFKFANPIQVWRVYRLYEQNFPKAKPRIIRVLKRNILERFLEKHLTGEDCPASLLMVNSTSLIPVRKAHILMSISGGWAEIPS
nr:hypothetical protein HmN_000256800 [Hymenolepis microstoma]